MAETEYSNKLKDPRWQKKRLEILQRDEFTCQKCGDMESTLHVHHKRYIPSNDPWEYPDFLLITLCENCHESEMLNIKEAIEGLIEGILDNFLAEDIQEISCGFHQLELQHSHEIVAGAISLALSSNEIQRELIKKFFKHLKADAKKKAGKGK